MPTALPRRLATLAFLVVIGTLAPLVQASASTATTSTRASTTAVVSPRATEAQFRAEIQRVDPRHTVVWSFSKPLGSEAGWTVGNRVNISLGLTVDWLRSIVLHEWSHVLQYRAFGSQSYSMNLAVASFNAVAGSTGSYGIEHGADCMALSLGATKLGYGCPANLKVFAGRIAHGLNMTRLIGAPTTATTSGSVFTTSGWVFDPWNPRIATAVRITDNGKAITGWISTNVVSPSTDNYYGIPGRHGYNVSVRLQPGNHQLCVTARRLTGTTAVTIHCWTKTTRAAAVARVPR